MRNKVSLLILSGNNAPRQITASKSFLRFLVVIMLCGIAFSAYSVSDYLKLKKSIAIKQMLENQVVGQRDTIASQRRQIQTFAGQINSLKSRLIALNKLEQKIRIVANLEETTANNGLFGVGGSMPADLDPKLSLKERHDRLLREMHEQTGKLDEASEIQNQNLSSLLKALEVRVNLLAHTPAIRPVKGGWVTSRFGYRPHPITKSREFHKGLDIASRAKTPILATADGQVTFTGRKGNLGRVIIIDHGHGIITRYGHIHSAKKKAGQKVKRGEIIALVGSTGRTTGPHVHYEVMLNGVQVDSSKYILN